MYTNADLVRRLAPILQSASSVVEPERTTLLFGFRLRSAKGAVPSRGIRCLDSQTMSPLAGVPDYPSNSDGEGLVFWQHRCGTVPACVVLEARLDDSSTWTRLAEVRLHPVLRTSQQVNEALTVDISTDLIWGDTGERSVPARVTGGTRRFRVALLGTSDQLRSVLPWFDDRSCVLLRAVYLAEDERQSLDIGQDVRVVPLANCRAEALEGIDAVILFEGDEGVADAIEQLSAFESPPMFFASRLFFNPDGTVRQTIRDWLESLNASGFRDAVE